MGWEAKHSFFFPRQQTFKVNGLRDNKSGVIVGDLETKYADRAKGITFTEAWTTSNHLNGKVELENNLASKYSLSMCGAEDGSN